MCRVRRRWVNLSNCLSKGQCKWLPELGYWKLLSTSGAPRGHQQGGGSNIARTCADAVLPSRGLLEYGAERTEIGKEISILVRERSVCDYDRFRLNKTGVAKIYAPVSPPMDHKGS